MGTATGWRFDSNNPYEDSFEQALLTTVDSPYVLRMVKRKCLDIQRDPKANYRGIVRGKLVYIAKTGAVKVGTVDIGSLLVVYTLAERERLIQRVFVCKAGQVLDDVQRPTDDGIAPALYQAIERALKNASNRVLFPAERTSIPEAQITKAVQRALKDRKPRK